LFCVTEKSATLAGNISRIPSGYLNMKAFFQFLLRLVASALLAIILLPSYLAVTYFVSPVAFKALAAHDFTSHFSTSLFLVQLVFIYLLYLLLLNVIGGEKLIQRFALPVETQADIIQIIFRVIAAILGLGALRILYGHFFIPDEYHSDMYSRNGRISPFGALIFIAALCLFYAFKGEK
jgi:hypothetical protein